MKSWGNFKRHLDGFRGTIGPYPDIRVVRVVFSPNQKHFHAANPFPSSFVRRMATFTKVECKDPSQAFWYVDRIKLPYNSAIDPVNKIIIDNDDIPQLDFAYLLAFCLNVLI